MNFLFLSKIVTEHAEELKLSASYSGSQSDGGYNHLISKLNDYKNKLVVELDLRPSEFSKLNDIEVGEPTEFTSIIDAYKVKLAKNITL